MSILGLFPKILNVARKRLFTNLSSKSENIPSNSFILYDIPTIHTLHEQQKWTPAVWTRQGPLPHAALALTRAK